MNKLNWHEKDGIHYGKLGKILVFQVYWNTASDEKGSDLPPYRASSNLCNIKMDRYRSIEDATYQCGKALNAWLEAAGLL